MGEYVCVHACVHACVHVFLFHASILRVVNKNGFFVIRSVSIQALDLYNEYIIKGKEATMY